MKVAGLNESELFKNVRAGVLKATKGTKNEQVPWEASSLIGTFYFKPAPVAVIKPTPIPVTPRDDGPEPVITRREAAAIEKEAWLLVRNSSDAQDFRDFLEAYPSGANAANAKIRLEQLAWEAARSNGSKAALEGYIKEFPNGDNAPTAKLMLSRLARANQPAPVASPAATPPPQVNSDVVKGNTTHGFSLLQQKQYAAALAEAKKVSAQFPNDPEAWKIAGFAQLSLNQYAAAAADLQKANDLLRATGKEDTFAFDALAQAYFLAEQYGKALPLLILATNRVTPKADNALLFYRGVAEFRAGQVEDAEKTFNEVVKANPKDTGALFYLGQFAYEKSDMTACINLLNRVTMIDPNTPDAWRLLASAYQRRAATKTDVTQADADYLGAVKAGEQLVRRSHEPKDTLLYAQALIGAKQYAKAVPLLERASAAKPTDGRIFFLLGAAQLRANNYPKATLAFEQAAKLTPNDTNVYRELGYAYEVQKQYAKALAASQKGAALAPNDAYFQESIARVKPFAK